MLLESEVKIPSTSEQGHQQLDIISLKEIISHEDAN